MSLTDIRNREDIDLFVRHFYQIAALDPLLAPHFEHIDFEQHFPRMIDFWAFLLLDQAGFKGNVFDAHRNLKIDSRHFERWLFHFNTTIDTLFAGEKADMAKQRAASIAIIFETKLQQLQ